MSTNSFDPKVVRTGDTVYVTERYSTNPDKVYEAQVVAKRIDDTEVVFIKHFVVQEEWVSLDRIKGIKVIDTLIAQKNKGTENV